MILNIPAQGELLDNDAEVLKIKITSILDFGDWEGIVLASVSFGIHPYVTWRIYGNARGVQDTISGSYFLDYEDGYKDFLDRR